MIDDTTKSFLEIMNSLDSYEQYAKFYHRIRTKLICMLHVPLGTS